MYYRIVCIVLYALYRVLYQRSRVILICFSVTGRELAWTFVKENWTDLHDRYEGGFLLSRLVKVSIIIILMLLVIGI